MSITLHHWAQHGYERVYVRGPLISGKTYLDLKRGALRATSDEYVDEAALLAEVRQAAGAVGQPDREAWNAIVLFAQQAPRRGARVAPVTASPVYAAPIPTRAGTHDLDITTIPIPGDVEFEVDHREPEALSTLLARAPNAKVSRVHLPLADVRINGRVLVERKTVADFEASVIDDEKRLFNQAERLAFEPETLVYLILEGDPYTQHRRMTMQQITGAITYLSAIKGLSVLQVPDMAATAYTLAKIAQHERHGLGYNLGLRTNKSSGLDARSYVLEGLPGVNGTLARRLLEHFGSVAAVCAARAADLRKVDGVGPKIATRIVEITQAGAAG